MRTTSTSVRLPTFAAVSLALCASGGIVAGCGSSDDPTGPASCTAPGHCDGGTNDADATPEPVPVTTHPRLLLTNADVPRLRSWAVDSNPIWANGLRTLAANARQAMDAGKIQQEDTGAAASYTPYAVEGYAELFAFLSLVDADDATRTDDAKRARTLLMYAIDKAAGGVAEGQPFQDTLFSTDNRSRWSGEGFPLTVDWIYGSLSSDDKATIRKVFSRWADENENATITGYNHPEPLGMRNDPQLTADPDHVFWAGNNYYTAHMRNIGLMAMALDDADDPGGQLRAHMQSVTGAWLYVEDALIRGGLQGGLGAEGFEYGPQTVGYLAQLLLALHTAGLDSSANGPQSKLAGNPFWDNTVTAFLHSVSPAGEVPSDPNFSDRGPLYSAAWYGDGMHFWAPDFINVYGPLGIYDQVTKNAARLSSLRWIETNVAPGGAAGIGARASANDFLIQPILYFMLFDPSAPPDADPRPLLPRTYYDPGLGHMFARTDWTSNASWFTYQLGWSRIDHQHADGNLFQLYRKGEWLTKERTGYGMQVACTDYKNGVALENDVPGHNDDYRHIEWTRGSQWNYVNDGAGKILGQVFGPGYAYALGDATLLYQSAYEGATDVTHASRSIVWIAPDRVVVYDRASSKTAGRFKRFWLNLPAQGSVAGRVTTVRTPKGQQLFVSTLLPVAATVSVEPAESLDGEPAELDTMNYRLRVEATGGPASTRFLHVLQGADGGAAADATTFVQSTGGTAFEGAAVNGVLVLFPVDIATPFSTVTYAAPNGTVAQLVTGLAPGSGYTVAQNGAVVTIAPGGSKTADSGGVLLIGALP